MTMLNREVYEKDPKTHVILNQGVAKVTSGQTASELETKLSHCQLK